MSHTRRGVFLAALALLAGSCRSAPTEEPDAAARLLSDVDALGEAVREAVADAGRRERAVARIGELRHKTATHLEFVGGLRKRIQELDSDFDAPRERFDALLAEWRARRERALERRAEFMIALKGELTRTEWSEVTAGMRRLRPEPEETGK